MKFRNFLLIFVLFLLTFFAYKISYAEEDVDTQTSIVVLSIPSACHLDITNPDQTKMLIQDGSAELAFEAGFTEFDSGTPTLKVSANKSWKLSARSSGFNDNAGYLKNTTDLQLKDAGASHVKNSFNDYKSLLQTDQEIASYTGGVKNEMHPCQYKILLDYTKDIPGTYTATVTYTLTTQP